VIDSVILVVSAHVESIFVSELYDQLIYHERWQELHGGQDYPMTNAASRGRGGPVGRGGFSRGFPAR
jgi:hypothetical protein